jgi:asparagine synthase (glutamine-hydrolysing)
MGVRIYFVKNNILRKNAGIYNYFDYNTVAGLIKEHIEGKHNRRLFVWSLLCFEWWLALFIKNTQIDKYTSEIKEELSIKI